MAFFNNPETFNKIKNKRFFDENTHVKVRESIQSRTENKNFSDAIKNSFNSKNLGPNFNMLNKKKDE